MEPIETIAERFWAKVNKQGRVVRSELGPCWEWTGPPGAYGYGQIGARKVSDHPLTTHTVAWRLGVGPIPAGLCVLHKCDNPLCCNYETHLFLGTAGDNARDRDAKGRTAAGDNNGARTRPERNPFVANGGSGLRGAEHPMATLSDLEVRYIRELSTGKRGDKAKLARRFGVSQAHIGRIVSGRSR